MTRIQILPLKNTTKRLRAFKRTEWKLIHPEHYGVEHDEEYWNPKPLILQAVEGKKIIGALVGELMAGVLRIKELIVKHDRRNRGIGKMLLNVRICCICSSPESFLKNRFCPPTEVYRSKKSVNKNRITSLIHVILTKKRELGFHFPTGKSFCMNAVKVVAYGYHEKSYYHGGYI